MKTIYDDETNFKQFDSSMLKIGEMMQVDNTYSDYGGHVLLMTFMGIISLTSPNYTWACEAELPGRKLGKGEVVTLIQE